jgi:hypothetical protein
MGALAVCLAVQFEGQPVGSPNVFYDDRIIVPVGLDEHGPQM